MAKCNEAEEWLYEDGAEAGYKEYQTKTYDLKSPFSKFKNRKVESIARTQIVAEMTESLTSMRDQLPDALEKKSWISEQEG